MTTDNFHGTGRKRPLVDVRITQLQLDNENPRLAEEYRGREQDEIFTVLFNEFDLEEIGYSMAENGYFDEEPIVAVPINLPKGFDQTQYATIDKLQVELGRLANEEGLEFLVVEGNRRVATAKILTDAILKKKFDPESIFPLPKSHEVEADLKIIPCIIYFDRKEISSYLGVRHIKGNLRWEAYAKSVYLARRIEEECAQGHSVEESMQIVRKRTADRTDTIKRQYMAYKILNEAEATLNFETKQIKKRFSLITEITNRPDIREYLGIGSYKETEFSKGIIPKNKHEEFRQVLTWVFGDGKEVEPLFKDSRLIPSRLAPILADEEATDYLIKYNVIEEAYERSGGEKKYFLRQLDIAKKKIENALSIAYKYRGDVDLFNVSEEIAKAAEELSNTLKK